MVRRRSTAPRWLRLPRWLAAGLCAGGLGCSGQSFLNHRPTPPVSGHWTAGTTALSPSPRPVPAAPGTLSPIQQVSHTAPAAPAPVEPKEIPITLDAVLRLAEQHNPRIGLAREKLHESHLTLERGSIGWIPNVYAGVGYYRHEGGIQDFQGNLVHSSYASVYPALQLNSELDLREGVFALIDLERRVWQQKTELSQVNNDVLMEAGLTYVDLLSARRGEALARELAKYEQKLLDREQKRVKTERGAAVLVEAVEATLKNREQLASRMRQQGNAASAKLVYLLGLPPGTCLIPVDELAPIELVDVTPPPCDLIELAYAGGPGVNEMAGVLDTVSRALEKTDTAHNLLPSVEANLWQGPFGAGPGASLGFDNRFDFGLRVKWNLTQICQSESKRELIRSKQTQVMFSYVDLKSKLALGVTESRDSILHGREQIGLAAAQIKHSTESYRLSDRRLEEGLPGASSSEVLIGVRNLEQAHFNHLQAIQNHNKSQVRLLLLLGGGPANVPPPAKALPVPATVTLPQPRNAEKDTNNDKDDKEMEKLPVLPEPKR